MPSVELRFSSAPLSTSASHNAAAVVTGAARGIGRGIALRLAQDGFDVSINDLSASEEELKDLGREIQGIGKRCSVFVGDVTNEVEVKGLVQNAVEKLGGIDVMVANAGIIFPKQFVETTVEDLDKHYAVNVRGVFMCYKYAGLQMINQGRGGRIIGASSIAGKQGYPLSSAYCASKFAVRGLTQSVAAELGRFGITVNAYAPGTIETDMTRNFLKLFEEHMLDLSMNPVGRMGEIEDIANTVSFLASMKSSFITGQTISVNGGIYFD